jgi:ribonuclease P protein component
MLPTANQLKKKKDFERIFKKGKGFKEDFLYLKVAPNNLEVSRFGFVTSKKFSANATARNKTKRRLRELIKTNLPDIKKGVDAVIVAMPGLKINDFWELEPLVRSLCEKAGIINIKDRS